MRAKFAGRSGFYKIGERRGLQELRGAHQSAVGGDGRRMQSRAAEGHADGGRDHHSGGGHRGRRPHVRATVTDVRSARLRILPAAEAAQVAGGRGHHAGRDRRDGDDRGRHRHRRQDQPRTAHHRREPGCHPAGRFARRGNRRRESEAADRRRLPQRSRPAKNQRNILAQQHHGLCAHAAGERSDRTRRRATGCHSARNLFCQAAFLRHGEVHHRGAHRPIRCGKFLGAWPEDDSRDVLRRGKTSEPFGREGRR